jgi:heme exporter protein D
VDVAAIMHVATHYLAMGGYAAFVWPAYGLAAAVMVALLVQSLRRYRGMQRALEVLQCGRRRRHRSAPPPTGGGAGR